jgi:hypothetical protein
MFQVLALDIFMFQLVALAMSMFQFLALDTFMFQFLAWDIFMFQFVAFTTPALIIRPVLLTMSTQIPLPVCLTVQA